MREKDRKKVVNDNFTVKSITISEEKVITKLVIVNQRSEEVYRWVMEKEKKSTFTSAEWKELYRELERTGVAEDVLLNRYGVNSLSEMDEDTRQKALKGLKRTKTAA